MQKKERRLLLIFLIGILLAGSVYLYGGRPGIQQASAQVDGGGNVTQQVPQQAQATVEANNQLIKVNVRGAVNHPGVFQLPSNSRVIDAIDAAGGAKDNANVQQLNLASTLADGADVTVPSKDAGQNQDGSMTTTAADKVNLNTATAAELDKLPGIGSIRAGAIISYRNDNGPFTQVDDLKNVPGFGNKLVEEIRNYVTVQ